MSLERLCSRATSRTPFIAAECGLHITVILDHVFNRAFRAWRDRGGGGGDAPLSWADTGPLPLTTMADTKRDDHGTSSIAREQENLSHEMRVLSAAAQISRGAGEGAGGGERYGFADALQDKGSFHEGGDEVRAPQWSNNSANAVAPRDLEEEDHGEFAAPITRQGLPSFAQSEFHTVCLILYSLHGCCSHLLGFPMHRLSVVNDVSVAVTFSR